jgi:hypothetical protein
MMTAAYLGGSPASVISNHRGRGRGMSPGYAGLSIDEIAAETGAQPGTVRARLTRGQRAMAPHLTDFAQSLETTPGDSRGLDQPRISRKGI